MLQRTFSKPTVLNSILLLAKEIVARIKITTSNFYNPNKLDKPVTQENNKFAPLDIPEFAFGRGYVAPFTVENTLDYYTYLFTNGIKIFFSYPNTRTKLIYLTDILSELQIDGSYNQLPPILKDYLSEQMITYFNSKNFVEESATTLKNKCYKLHSGINSYEFYEEPAKQINIQLAVKFEEKIGHFFGSYDLCSEDKYIIKMISIFIDIAAKCLDFHPYIPAMLIAKLVCVSKEAKKNLSRLTSYKLENLSKQLKDDTVNFEKLRQHLENNPKALMPLIIITKDSTLILEFANKNIPKRQIAVAYKQLANMHIRIKLAMLNPVNHPNNQPVSMDENILLAITNVTNREILLYLLAELNVPHLVKFTKVTQQESLNPQVCMVDTYVEDLFANKEQIKGSSKSAIAQKAELKAMAVFYILLVNPVFFVKEEWDNEKTLAIKENNIDLAKCFLAELSKEAYHKFFIFLNQYVDQAPDLSKISKKINEDNLFSVLAIELNKLYQKKNKNLPIKDHVYVHPERLPSKNSSHSTPQIKSKIILKTSEKSHPNISLPINIPATNTSDLKKSARSRSGRSRKISCGTPRPQATSDLPPPSNSSPCIIMSLSSSPRSDTSRDSLNISPPIVTSVTSFKSNEHNRQSSLEFSLANFVNREVSSGKQENSHTHKRQASYTPPANKKTPELGVNKGSLRVSHTPNRRKGLVRQFSQMPTKTISPDPQHIPLESPRVIVISENEPSNDDVIKSNKRSKDLYRAVSSAPGLFSKRKSGEKNSYSQHIRKKSTSLDSKFHKNSM